MLDVNGVGSTIPMLKDPALTKLIKSSISCYMVFVKEHVQNLNVLNESQGEIKEDSEKSKLLQEFKTFSRMTFRMRCLLHEDKMTII